MFDKPEPTYHELRDEIRRLREEVEHLTGGRNKRRRAERMGEMRDQARERWHEARDMASQRMHEADEYMHRKPWQVLGAAVVAALILGMVSGGARRKRWRDC